MFGNRTVCAIGRGDSAQRVLGRKPTTLQETEDAIHVIRDLACGREITTPGGQVSIPWVKDGSLEVYMAAYGPKALAVVGRSADGFVLQLADPVILRWTLERVRAAAQEAGRDPAEIKVLVCAPAYVGDDLAHQRDQCRWFGGMVGNHVHDLVTRYGSEGDIPRGADGLHQGREGYDYAHHGKAGNPTTDFVPDEIVDRFCILGPPGGARGQARGAARPGRRPVRDLPHARRPGGDAGRLRRARHPRAERSGRGRISTHVVVLGAGVVCGARAADRGDMGPRPLLRLGLAAFAAVLAAPTPALAGDLAGAAALAASAAPAAVPGRVVVGFAPDASAAERRAARAAVDGDLVGSVLPGVQVLEVPEGTERAAAAALARDDDTTWAQPDVPVRALDAPDDPLFPSQWAWANTGQISGTAGADIKALEAWESTRGADTLVAVVDSGVTPEHPDAGARQVNAGEIAGNRRDDDRNGRVDDVLGWDFVNADNDPLDDDGHGTAVAAVVNARRNNAVGMTGVAPRARVLPVKVLDQYGEGAASDVAAGMDYAARRGARIVNLSIGGGRFTGYTSVLAAHPNVLFVVAAGNDSQDNDLPGMASYPCAEPAPNVLCVGASTPRDTLASFSGRGATTVDLLAPGERIAGHSLDGGTMLWTGTSFSSPMAAGVAALVLSRTPTATAAELKQALMASVDPVPSPTRTTVTGGRLNAARALTVLPPSPDFVATPVDPPESDGPGTAPPAGEQPRVEPAPAPAPAPAPPPAVVEDPALLGSGDGLGEDGSDPDARTAPAPRPVAPRRPAAPLTVTVSRTGRLTLPATCRAARCTAVVRLYTAPTGTPRSGASRPASAPRTLVGSGSATLRGTRGAVGAVLTRRGRSLLAARGHLRVVVELRTGREVVRRDADLRRR
jgi:subtilisin family serine protease